MRNRFAASGWDRAFIVGKRAFGFALCHHIDQVRINKTHMFGPRSKLLQLHGLFDFLFEAITFEVSIILDWKTHRPFLGVFQLCSQASLWFGACW